MNTVLAVLSWFALGLMGIPVLLWCAELLLAHLPFRRGSGLASEKKRPAAVVLVAAHNEQSVIEQPLREIRKQMNAGDRLLVIADNCSDDTATVAASAGAHVLERHDLTRRGKGYALAHGVAALATDPPPIVVLMDADCLPAPAALASLIAAAASTNRPVQASYVLECPSDAGARESISAFAFLVKNHVRALGADRLGISCLLRGTGMAFPWETIRSAPLASGNIVEDLQLGIDLAVAGHAPIFCPNARVVGAFPSADADATTQRRRWEHGHLRTITHSAFPLLLRSFRLGRPDLALLALDIMIPPLSLLVLGWSVLGAFLGVAAVFAGVRMPLIVWIAGSVLLFAALLGSWARFGRDVISARALAAIPFYVLKKIPLYVGYLVSPQRQWVRTGRDVESPAPSSEKSSQVLKPTNA